MLEKFDIIFSSAVNKDSHCLPTGMTDQEIIEILTMNPPFIDDTPVYKLLESLCKRYILFRIFWNCCLDIFFVGVQGGTAECEV